MGAKEAGEKAEKYFNSGYNCAQSVFKALKDEFKELENVDEFLLTGFGGGFARKGFVCGAVSGVTAAVSVIKADKTNIKDKTELYKLLGEFIDDFKKTNKSLSCRAITGLDFSKKEEAEKYSREVHLKICVPLVKNTAEKAYNLLKH